MLTKGFAPPDGDLHTIAHPLRGGQEFADNLVAHIHPESHALFPCFAA